MRSILIIGVLFMWSCNRNKTNNIYREETISLNDSINLIITIEDGALSSIQSKQKSNSREIGNQYFFYHNTGQIYSVNKINLDSTILKLIYYPSGILERKYSYSDYTFKKGHIMGNDSSYHLNGILKSAENWDNNGNPIGIHEYYYPSGELKMKIEYNNSGCYKCCFDRKGNKVDCEIR